jgi:cell division septum initiation protein DivIVA
MNYMQAIEALEKMVEEARSVPLSSSAVIPREEALKLVREVKSALPQEHQQARDVLDQRESLLTEAHEKAAYIIEQAREERSRLLSRAEVVQAAEREAKRVVDAAQAESEHLTHQADDYVDAKLANFEILLSKVLRTVGRGREQLRKRLEAHMGEVAPLEFEDSGEISGPLPQIERE